MRIQVEIKKTRSELDSAPRWCKDASTYPYTVQTNAALPQQGLLKYIKELFRKIIFKDKILFQP